PALSRYVPDRLRRWSGLAGPDQLLKMFGHLCNSRCFEKARDLNVDIQDVMYLGDNARDRQGIATQREEVVMDADLLDLQDLCPKSAELLLERRPGRNVAARRGNAVAEPQLRRQANTLHFARGAFGKLRYDQDLAWHLEIGDVSADEL